MFVLLYLALGSFGRDGWSSSPRCPIAFVGGIVALLLAGETWNVSSLVGLIGLFGIAVQNSLVLVTQTRGAGRRGPRRSREALREASIGRVRPKLMTAGTAILGLLPLLVLRLHGTEIERPLAIVMIGGLVTSTLFTLLALPTFYLLVHEWLDAGARAARPPGRCCRSHGCVPAALAVVFGDELLESLAAEDAAGSLGSAASRNRSGSVSSSGVQPASRLNCRLVRDDAPRGLAQFVGGHVPAGDRAAACRRPRRRNPSNTPRRNLQRISESISAALSSVSMAWRTASSVACRRSTLSEKSTS